MSLVIHQATLKDVDFLLSLVINGARKGHFNTDLLRDKKTSRNLLSNIVTKGFDLGGRESYAYVSTYNGLKVGCVLLTASNTDDLGLELSAIAIKKEFQGHGFGSMFLKHVLAEWLPRRNIYARFLSKSEKAKEMFKKVGFCYQRQLGEAEVYIHYRNSIDLGIKVRAVGSALRAS